MLRACLAATWSDRAMSPEERRYIISLIDSLSDSEEERERFRKQALGEIKPELVLAEIEPLGPEDKRWIFEECLSLLASDKDLGRPDLRFLGRLRKLCGVGYWSFQMRLLGFSWRGGIKIIRWKPLVTLAVVGFIALNILYMRQDGSPKKYLPPAKPSGHEIILGSARPWDLPPAHDAEGVYAIVRDSVVTVEALVDGKPKAMGSGSVIGTDEADGVYILTNKHVVEFDKKPDGRISYRVLLHTGASFDARLDFYSEKHDLAILLVADIRERTVPFGLTLKRELKVGQPVYALGSPQELKHTFTAGIVSALRPKKLQTDATISSGSSGGPLIDSRGRLAGIMTSSYRLKNFAFALYADAFLEALKERRKKAPKK